MGANLVVVEIAVAVVLLCAAGLLGKSFYRLLHVDVGLNTDHLAAVYTIAPDKQYEKDEQKNLLYDRIRQEVGKLPGVQSVGLASDLPLQCNCNSEWIRISGKPFHGEHNEVLGRDASREYLQTIQARLVRGRFPGPGDRFGAPGVSVINEALARRYFPGEDPVGKTILGFDGDPKSARQIIGVIADVREGALDAELWPAEYRMLEQDTSNYFAVVVRTVSSEKALLPGIVNAIRSVDPNLGVYGEIAMQQQLETTQAAILHRCAAWLVGGFAVVALILGVLGLYGVVAYSVSQRTREIGVRIALGAQKSSVYGMVLRQAAWLTCAGVAIGWACAIGSALLMRKLLFDVHAWDVSTLAAVALVLAAAALLAAFVPARRATRVNPMEALRTE
jgi:predicted permease